MVKTSLNWYSWQLVLGVLIRIFVLKILLKFGHIIDIKKCSTSNHDSFYKKFFNIYGWALISIKMEHPVWYPSNSFCKYSLVLFVRCEGLIGSKSIKIKPVIRPFIRNSSPKKFNYQVLYSEGQDKRILYSSIYAGCQLISSAILLCWKESIKGGHSWTENGDSITVGMDRNGYVLCRTTRAALLQHHLLTDWLTDWLTDIITYWLTYLLTYWLTYWIIYLFTYLLNYLLTYWIIYLLIYLLIELFTYLLNYLLTYLLTYSLTYRRI